MSVLSMQLKALNWQLLNALVAVGSCCGALSCSQPKPGCIEFLVWQAKREGRTSVELLVDAPEAIEATLSELIEHYSLVEVSATRVAATHSRHENYIETWNVFRVIETLSVRQGAEASR